MSGQGKQGESVYRIRNPELFKVTVRKLGHLGFCWASVGTTILRTVTFVEESGMNVVPA